MIYFGNSAITDRELQAKLGQQRAIDLPLICKLQRTSASQNGELTPGPERVFRFPIAWLFRTCY